MNWQSFKKEVWPEFWCDIMGWHKAPLRQGFDGASLNGRCPRCGKRVLRDSQGNWFSVGEHRPQGTLTPYHEREL